MLVDPLGQESLIPVTWVFRDTRGALWLIKVDNGQLPEIVPPSPTKSAHGSDFEREAGR